jgi:Envelope integrity protein A
MITYSSGTQSTWSESWKSSEFITTKIAFTSRSAATPQEKGSGEPLPAHAVARPATVHDVRDFYTVTKKTGQALQSATYVKLTRRKAPASAPIRPVYDLPATDAIYQRFVGIDGSAYFVGGLGMTTLTFNNIVVVPICSGVGLRLGANVGYLKFTPTATWNPF